MRIVNPRTIEPNEIQQGDVMLCIIKAVVTYQDGDDIRYRVYKCHYPNNEGGIPQGSIVLDDRAVARNCFPTLARVGSVD